LRKKKGAPKGPQVNSPSLSITSYQFGLTNSIVLLQMYLSILRKPMRHLIQCLIFSMVAYSTMAIAQRCGATCANAESLLGTSEQALLGSIPELKRVPKPVPGPRNSRGKWSIADIVFATQPYGVTYFIGGGHVTRIELLSAASKDKCTQRIPFELALAELGKTYGESHASGTFEGGGISTQSAAFATDAVDVSLQLSVSPDDCSTRVIYKTRLVKDASEL